MVGFKAAVNIGVSDGSLLAFVLFLAISLTLALIVRGPLAHPVISAADDSQALF